jgi:tetratricopeptide (TPR) repeat protein
MRKLLVVFGAAALSLPLFAQESHDHSGAAQGEKLGTVHFTTSCSAAAQASFDRAVALLHSFEFGPAIDGFDATLKIDPTCGITQWGVALARWGNPFAVGARPASQLTQGQEAIAKARAAGLETDRERAYVDAAAELYRNPAARSQQVRVVAYRDAMDKVAAHYRDDMEASIFFALSLTASEDLNDKTYAGRKRAIAILEPLFAAHPDHPGLAHYIIHSDDVPALAPEALTAARRYASIAPSAPHALHMPSHIFTRVGLWQESITTNLASVAASRRENTVGEELHASDYLMYAYLQTAEDAKAKGVLDGLPDIARRLSGGTASAAPPSAGAFALAAMPARFALERGAWREAAALDPRPSAVPYADALTYFARAIGAARSQDVPSAQTAIAELAKLHEREDQLGETYWSDQIGLERRSAEAWLAFAEGRHDEALVRERAAADGEDRTEKAAVTPGPLAPARELLAEMLLETARPADALKEFEAVLAREPNRFRTVAGAMEAAARAGDTGKAKRYATALVTICASTDGPPRPELTRARALAAAH